VKVSLTFPSPRESTVTILILFHGFGDSEETFTNFARNLALPGVLAISVRGTNPLPPALLGEPLDSDPAKHFHWGDDLTLAPETGELDPDPGFEKATNMILGRLIRETLVDKCGWNLNDLFLFGYGQGGSLALGLASQARMGSRVAEAQEADSGESDERAKAFKGVISIGGFLPSSMIPSISARTISRTPVLLCHGYATETTDDDAVGLVKNEFSDVKRTRWKKPDDSMPRNREEMLPIMQFFAERLQRSW
jgi:predicted esterase